MTSEDSYYDFSAGELDPDEMPSEEEAYFEMLEDLDLAFKHKTQIDGQDPCEFIHDYLLPEDLLPILKFAALDLSSEVLGDLTKNFYKTLKERACKERINSKYN